MKTLTFLTTEGSPSMVLIEDIERISSDKGITYIHMKDGKIYDSKEPMSVLENKINGNGDSNRKLLLG